MKLQFKKYQQQFVTALGRDQGKRREGQGIEGRVPS